MQKIQLKTGFLRLPEVLELIPVKKSTWWSGVDNGIYPKPVKLSKRVVAWRAADIEELMERFNSNPPIKAEAAPEGQGDEK